jgi:hypothetical protein
MYGCYNCLRIGLNMVTKKKVSPITPTDDVVVNYPTDVKFCTIARNIPPSSDPSIEGNFIIYNTTDWKTFWLNMFPGFFGPSVPIPEIDFSLYTAIAVVSPLKEYSGDAYYIDSMTRESSGIMVNVQDYHNLDSCVKTSYKHHDYHIVYIKKDRSMIQFRKLKEFPIDCKRYLSE